MGKRIKKDKLQLEGESLFASIVKAITGRKYKIRTAVLTDEMANKGGKRFTLFLQERQKK